MALIIKCENYYGFCNHKNVCKLYCNELLKPKQAVGTINAICFASILTKESEKSWCVGKMTTFYWFSFDDKNDVAIFVHF